ncbi:DNA alkylation repair protein [Litorivita pollutaquae]|uniref:DNA alkylation repair protein n=1 Tax=Litorivita pollutaquae TaxID=2200892 RepID=A0A2V4N443_9RHOB|nr:DNA alkylation repair protein [Litorivita pollutaquae]PYC48672.1 DNA alkylation repair protein [Litorivita pollutaquae]
MTLDAALHDLRAHIEEGRAQGMAEYHKAPRDYLGVPNPAINDLAKNWRQDMNVAERVALASALWDTDIFEARLAAAKLLTQARIKDDQAVWDLIVSWVPQFDSWAIADHAMMAGQKRLVAHPERIEEIEAWTKSEHHWTRRAAMVITLPYTKQNHPKPEEMAIRKRVLGWATNYVRDPDWFIQKSVAWWIRDLSKHDPERAQYFLTNNAKDMKPFARKEAAKFLGPKPKGKATFTPDAPSKTTENTAPEIAPDDDTPAG